MTCIAKARGDYSAPNTSIGVLLSGGVDSSLLLAMLNKSFPHLTIVCLTSYTGSNDQDVAPAQEVSHHFGNPWVRAKITHTYVEYALPIITRLPHAGLYITAANIALLRCLEECAKRGISELWIGNGIDMMFGGGVNPRQFTARKRDKTEFHKEFWEYSMELLINRFYRLGYNDIAQLAAAYNIRIVMPFANQEAILCARSIYAPLFFKTKHDKYPVRLLARKLGVPSREAFRRKQILQESSGIFELLEEHMFRELPDLIPDGVNTRYDEKALQNDPLLALRLYIALKTIQTKTPGN